MELDEDEIRAVARIFDIDLNENTIFQIDHLTINYQWGDKERLKKASSRTIRQIFDEDSTCTIGHNGSINIGSYYGPRVNAYEKTGIQYDVVNSRVYGVERIEAKNQN